MVTETGTLVPLRRKSQVGLVLETWRHHRHLSQLELSAISGVTPRHVSFVETGRSNPSRELLHTLAQALDMPLRDRNGLFLAAGFAPPYRSEGLDHADEVAAAFRRILDSHEPLPGVVMDRHWNLVTANHAAQQLFARMIDLSTVGQPANILRLIFGPLRANIDNFAELAPSLLARARREAIGAVPDTELQALLDELAQQLPVAAHTVVAHRPIIDVAFRIDGSIERYFSTVATLGTALDVELQELRIELFHPSPQ
jgi:transcriptional regulator with XRE-family HTH domain